MVPSGSATAPYYGRRDGIFGRNLLRPRRGSGERQPLFKHDSEAKENRGYTKIADFSRARVFPSENRVFYFQFHFVEVFMKLPSILSATLVGVLLASVSVTPAFAEGSWSSHIKGWATGITSRNWTDRATDKASTRTVLSKCSQEGGARFKSVTLRLYAKRGLLPDRNQGDRTISCGTASWGAMPKKDDFYFKLVKINGSERGYKFSAKSVKQYY